MGGNSPHLNPMTLHYRISSANNQLDFTLIATIGHSDCSDHDIQMALQSSEQSFEPVALNAV
jgi:hypothetical protein